MDDTHDYVERLHENQRKASRNKRRQAKGNHARKLPNKRH
ncbi:DUF4023 domain-containing protein [Oceanobacillus halotolerans]|nr:DUF4023 domain-containing protein [Oceanobacillus halotolerans]